MKGTELSLLLAEHYDKGPRADWRDRADDGKENWHLAEPGPRSSSPVVQEEKLLWSQLVVGFYLFIYLFFIIIIL